MKSFVATSLILAAGVAADRSFTVVNKCSYTIWSVCLPYMCIEINH